MSVRRQKPEDRILYVYYDKVCPKADKKRAIARRFGAQYGMSASRAPGAKSADPAGRDASSERTGAYTYRPGPAQGGEAVRERPLKLLLEKAVNLIETVEERAKRDERIARESAIAWRKLHENRRVFFTSLAILALIAVFLLICYRVFFVIDEVEVDGSRLYTGEEVTEAAGVSVGDNLYSFSADEVENRIPFFCPYVKSVEVERTVPKSVSITLEDDAAVFYANIWGDCVKLSAGLRVLEVSPMQNAVTEGLAELILPPVSYSVGGRPLSFSDPKDERYVRNVISEALKSELGAGGRISRLDLSDKYNLKMTADGKFEVRLGGEEDSDLKLKLIYKTISSPEFDPAREAAIDVSSADHAIVLYRNSGVVG